LGLSAEISQTSDAPDPDGVVKLFPELGGTVKKGVNTSHTPFRPVLTQDSEMHPEHNRLWNELFEQVSVNPPNFF
jgi:hypothetical protein